MHEGTVESSPGALEALGRDPGSRKRFLKMAGGSALAGAFAATLAACGSGKEGGGTDSGGEMPSPARGDIETLNFALTLEYVEADFYERVLGAGIFSGRVADLLRRIGDNEREHVEALRASVEKLGGPVEERPTTQFPLEGGPKSVLVLAAKLENTGAGAYLGAAQEIQDAEVLAQALSIHAVEGRHAAVLNRLVGEPFTPDGPLAAPLERSEVVRRVEPFIVG